MTKGDVPPWGFMDKVAQADADGDRQPKGWNKAPADWVPWRNALVEDIHNLIWPKYKPDGADWKVDRITRLNDADFALLKRLTKNLGLQISGPQSPRAIHVDLFDEEDSVEKPFGSSYECYDPIFVGPLKAQMSSVLMEGVGLKAGRLSFQLKRVFQRPRPWQVAYINDPSTTYSYRQALSANTPSLVSGHCLQGSMAGCNAFAVFGASMNAQSLNQLQHFTVDIGDRRVFAGVHYPSDNLSSWYAALKLIEHVFDDGRIDDVKAFFAKAIDRSLVYQAILGFKSAEGSPYEPALRALAVVGGPKLPDGWSPHGE